MALLDQILQIAYFASFFLVFVYGTRIQTTIVLVGVKRSLGRLGQFKKAARDSVLTSALRFKADQKEVESRVDRLTGSFAITPVSMDPHGIVPKLEHVLNTYDENLKMEVRKMAPGATDAEVNTLTNQMEISIGLDQMYRVVRNLLVVRAKGPGGSVGKPGLAVEKLIQENSPVSLVITVDAALKFEGENSGEVVEGVGAAIGGPGVDRYHIEQTAARNRVPLIAIVVKMSNKEAIASMTQQIKSTVDEAIQRVKNTIIARTKAGETVIVAGIGNTMGVP